MMTRARFNSSARTLLAVTVLASSAGCHLSVDSHPRDVAGAFLAAMSRVQRIERTPPEARGRARSVQVRAYDAAEDRLVSLSVPLWLVRKFVEHSGEQDLDLGESAPGLRLNMEDVLKHGPGLLVQAETEDDRVLVWLE